MATALIASPVLPLDPARADFETVLGAYTPKIRRWARQYVIPGMDFEDREQLACVGLWQAYRSYQPRHHIPFSSWAGFVVKRHFVTAWRTAQREQRTPPTPLMAFDAVHAETGLTLADQIAAEELSPEDQAVGALMEQMWWDQAAQVLSDREWQVLIRRVAGLPHRQIAARLGISLKSVDNSWERVKRKLRPLWRSTLP